MPICPRGGVEITHLGMHLHIDLYGAINLSDVDCLKNVNRNKLLVCCYFVIEKERGKKVSLVKDMIMI